MSLRLIQLHKVNQEETPCQAKQSYTSPQNYSQDQDTIQIKMEDFQSNNSSPFSRKLDRNFQHINDTSKYYFGTEEHILHNRLNFQSEDAFNKVNSQSKFKDLMFKIKLKFMGQRILSKIPSRMFKNLNLRQLKLIDDKAYSSIGRKSEPNKLTTSLRKNTKKLLNKQDSLLVERFQISFLSTCTSFFRVTIWNNVILPTINQYDKKFPVMDPTSLFKIIWDIITIFIIIIYFFQIPLYITFQGLQNIPFHFILIQSIPPFVFFDILISLNTGIYEKGRLIKKRTHLIRINFSKFIMPNLMVFLCFSAYFFLKSNFSDSDQTDLRSLDILLLVFFLKAQSLSQSLNKFQEIIIFSKKQKNIIALINLIFKIVFIAHIISCIWILISEFEQNRGESKTWLKTLSFADNQWSKLYINAYYFTTVTMITVGFGDFLPITDLEKTVSILIMIFSSGVFAYSMNTIGSILQNFNEDEVKMQQNISIINSYMHKKNVNKKTQSAIREYLEYYWKEESDRNQESEEKIIQLLSENLKEKLQFEAKNVVFRQSSIFKNNFSECVRQKMIPLIKEHRATPDEVICTEGVDDDCSIYFIEKGSVEIFIDTSQNKTNIVHKQLITITKGQSFGELSFFSGQTRSMCIRSKEFTTLLILKREDFLQLVRNHIDDYERFCTIKDSISLYNDCSLLNLECLSCGQIGHLIKYCPYIHFSPNDLKMRQQFIYYPPQERKQYDRFITQKYNSLINYYLVNQNAIALQTNYEIQDPYSSDSQSGNDNSDDEDGGTSSFIPNKKINNQQDYENQIESRTIVSPLPYLQNQQQSMNMDKNTLKTVSFHQIEDHRESIIFDENQNSKSPLYSNQKNAHSHLNFKDKDKDAYVNEANKNISIPILKEDYEYEYDEEGLRAKYLHNINKGILINKDYHRNGSRNSRNERMCSKISNTLEHSFTPGSSLSNKMSSMRKLKHPKNILKLDSILKQIIQLFQNETKNISEKSSPTVKTPLSPWKKQNEFSEISQFENKSHNNFNNIGSSFKDTQSTILKILSSRLKETIQDNYFMFLDGFDSVKSYAIYYPLNNIENQIHLMELSKDKKRQKMMRNHFDNMTEIRKQKTIKNNYKNRSSFLSVCSSMNNVSLKVQAESFKLRGQHITDEKDVRKSKFFQNSININKENNDSSNSESFMNQSNGHTILQKSYQTIKISKNNNKNMGRKSDVLRQENSLDNMDDSYQKSSTSFCQQYRQEIDCNDPQNISISNPCQRNQQYLFDSNNGIQKGLTSKELKQQASYQTFQKQLVESTQEKDVNQNNQQQQTSNNYDIKTQKINNESPQSINSQNKRWKQLQINTSKLSNVKNIQNEINLSNDENYQIQVNLQGFQDSNKCDIETDLELNSETKKSKGNKINIFSNTQSIFAKKQQRFQQN